MTLVTLREVLHPALREGHAVAGVVCLGWSDTRAYVEAAEAEGVPIILQAGPGARDHMPLSVWGAMFRSLGEAASVPVVAHLDHGYALADCRAAIDCGFTSVMFDGSRLPLAQNIDDTAAIATLARAAGVSCEGEIGFVGYDGGAESAGTDPSEAARFARETGVDALAISVGNVHLQQQTGAGLDETRIARIAAVTDVPLVIHGGSGVPHAQRTRLARDTAICKFNIGTELRRAYGAALRETLQADAGVFDRIAIENAMHAPMVAAARSVLRGLWPQHPPKVR